MIARMYDSVNDPYNKLHKRNARNTPYRHYNCGGYALNTFNIYNPACPYPYYFESPAEAAERTIELIDIMLKEFRGSLRVIHSLEELKKDEYAVAFRFTSSWATPDFHFIRRHKNGQWFEKQGCTIGLYRVSKDEVFSGCWKRDFLVYDSPLVLFAKKD